MSLVSYGELPCTVYIDAHPLSYWVLFPSISALRAWVQYCNQVGIPTCCTVRSDGCVGVTCVRRVGQHCISALPWETQYNSNWEFLSADSALATTVGPHGSYIWGLFSQRTLPSLPARVVNMGMELRGGKELASVAPHPPLREAGARPQEIARAPRRHSLPRSTPAKPVKGEVEAGVQQPSPPQRFYMAADEEKRLFTEEDLLRRAEELAEARVASLSQAFVSLCNRVPPPRAQPSLSPEDGRNIRTFLDVAELEFLNSDLPRTEWGKELRRYLRGDALSYWLLLFNSHVDLTDWNVVKSRFRMRFCGDTRDRVLARIASLRWNGNHHAYSHQYAQIVSSGEALSQRDMVSFFLANLPNDVFDLVTEQGQRNFSAWEDAADALARLAEPRQRAREERDRDRLLLAAALRREGAARPPDPPRNRQGRVEATESETRRQTLESANSERVPGGGSGSAPPVTCTACRGRGHPSAKCPTHNSALLKPGKTCTRCGGLNHFSQDCATERRPPQEARTSPNAAAHPNGQA